MRLNKKEKEVLLKLNELTARSLGLLQTFKAGMVYANSYGLQNETYSSKVAHLTQLERLLDSFCLEISNQDLVEIRFFNDSYIHNELTQKRVVYLLVSLSEELKDNMDDISLPIVISNTFDEIDSLIEDYVNS